MRLFIIIFSLFFIFAVSSIGISFYLWTTTSPERLQTVEYDLKSGTSLQQIAKDLEKLKVIKWKHVFIWAAKYRGEDRKIKAGTYLFDPHMLPYQVLFKMISGHVELVQVTLAEGLNIWQVMEILSKKFPHITHSEWQSAIVSPVLIKETEFKEQISSLEGFLFPETYLFNPHSSVETIFRTIISHFKKNFSQKIKESGLRLNLSPYQVLTIASILEKESSNVLERSHIASVYLNRLRIGMRLQADPTVIYGIWQHYPGFLTRKHLLKPSPYNTYLNHGIPPGPICNPGLASLVATVHPKDSDDLYFVANGDDGLHTFSKNLINHNKAKRIYKEKLKQKKIEGENEEFSSNFK